MNDRLKFTLRKVRLNAQGYTSRGEYYGSGQALYWYCSDDGYHDNELRASSRDNAKAQIRALHKGARFYR
jgi:hypothetical protein